MLSQVRLFPPWRFIALEIVSTILYYGPIPRQSLKKRLDIQIDIGVD